MPPATFIHHTSYHTSIACCPSTLFHGREPIKPTVPRFARANRDVIGISSIYVAELQDAMQIKFGENKLSRLDSYHRYRSFYDEKALAHPLEEQFYCLLLTSKLTKQSESIGKAKKKWIPLYSLEKVLTISNYIVHKIGVNFTQCVHRIRLRPVKKNQKLLKVSRLSIHQTLSPTHQENTAKASPSYLMTMCQICWKAS